jgi:mRNA interferase RelE/StbE
MAHEIEFTDDALRDYRGLQTHIRATIRDALEVHLRHQPNKASKSRIKSLRELSHPQYRLRVGEFRIYYDVDAGVVTILGIVAKSDSWAWLADKSIQDND